MKHLSVIMLVVVVLFGFYAPAQVVEAQAQEYLCSTWGVVGADKTMIANDVINAALTLPYVTRFTLEWTRMINPSSEYQINLSVYCSSQQDSLRVFKDIINTLRALYPERWGHLQPM